MKIVVVTTIFPFVTGGAEYLAGSLTHALSTAGHQVELFNLPFSYDYRTIIQEAMAFRLLDFSGAGDRLIAIRTPSYVVQHHSKVVWSIHHRWQNFDVWGTPCRDVPSDPIGEGYRDAFRSVDSTALREARSVYANSHSTRRRLREFNQIDADVLYPPLPADHGHFCSSYGDYIFCPGRVTAHKRQQLCIQAMRLTRTPVRLIVAGPPDCPEDLDGLQQSVSSAGVTDKVVIMGRSIQAREQIDLFANALAIAYVPDDDDSCGYAALEAAESHKALVTCTDCGGLAEFVEDGLTGYIADPQPASLASCFDRLWDRNTARRMGEAAFERRSALGISWERVMEKLLA